MRFVQYRQVQCFCMKQGAATTAAHVTLSVIAGWPASIVPKPALHGSGLDELACLALPMLLLGVVFLFVMRVRPPGQDDQERQGSSVEAFMPKDQGQGDDQQPEPPVK